MTGSWGDVCVHCVELFARVPLHITLITVFASVVGLLVLFYTFLYLVAPIPRQSFPEEKKYRTLAKDGSITKPEPLPCWHDAVLDFKKKSGRIPDSSKVEPAELFMSVVVPAYNEEGRLGGMLEEAVNYLERMYGTLAANSDRNATATATSDQKNTTRQRKPGDGQGSMCEEQEGWEILIVSDGSKDRTEEVAFKFVRDHQLSLHPKGYAGPWTPRPQEGVPIPPGAIRVVTITQNRGKGGAVTHGLRHVRGQYVVFADADGATKFDDLGKLVDASREIQDADGRAVAVGSRAHMVGSEAVVKRSKLRNFLMHSFHLILWLLTPAKTAMIKDTQCGFKLFSRASLPYIVPYMHSEGWIFDVEVLMLAEFARIPVAEVAVGWREVTGSKLNVIRDSIGMAWGLAVLRAAWSLGVYRRNPGINKYSLTLRRLKNVTDYPRKLSPVATIVLIIPLHVPEKKNRGTQNLTNPIYHKIGHDSPQPNRTV